MLSECMVKLGNIKSEINVAGFQKNLGVASKGDNIRCFGHVQRRSATVPRIKVFLCNLRKSSRPKDMDGGRTNIS